MPASDTPRDLFATPQPYSTVTTHGDFGPWISKIILHLPCTVSEADVSPDGFSVFCARHERTGEVLMRKEHGSATGSPSVGYVDVLAAYPCTETGERAATGTHVALELPETRLTKRIEGGVTVSRNIENRFRVTQTRTLAHEGHSVCGLVFETRAQDIQPALEGWHTARMSQPVNGIQLEYGYFEPDFAPVEPSIVGPFGPAPQKPEKAALILWLHGAGEGTGETVGEGPERAYTGNRVTALSQAKIQNYFDGAAWVVVPQSPTFWMDDGVETLGRSNKSIYTEPLKALLDEFIAEHADRIDTSRIIVGGLSNGGFMTVRMCIDYPDFFAAGIPVCAPFFEENQSDAVVAALGKTPLWFVHSKGDELVDPKQTVLPLYRKLAAAGSEAHLTYFDHVEDLTGVYREADGSPKKTFNHGVWIHIYNDFCRTEVDGTNVLIDQEPVGAWEWAARQRK